MREPADRRRILATAALIAPASLLPTIAELAAAVANDDPHPAWYAEWNACLDWCNAPGNMGDRDAAEFPQFRRLSQLEELILPTPAATLAGALTQLRILNHWHGEETAMDERDSAGLANAIATL